MVAWKNCAGCGNLLLKRYESESDIARRYIGISLGCLINIRLQMQTAASFILCVACPRRVSYLNAHVHVYVIYSVELYF